MFNKKGNAVLDSFMLLMILLALIITIFVGKYVMDEVNTDIQASDDMTNISKEIIGGHNTNYGNRLDAVFLIVFVLLWALTLVASFNIDSHPAFMALTLVLLTFMFVLAVWLGNAYEEIVSDNALTIYKASFPIANYLMTHLLMVGIVIGSSIVLVLYAKGKT